MSRAKRISKIGDQQTMVPIKRRNSEQHLKEHNYDAKLVGQEGNGCLTTQVAVEIAQIRD